MNTSPNFGTIIEMIFLKSFRVMGDSRFKFRKVLCSGEVVLLFCQK